MNYRPLKPRIHRYLNLHWWAVRLSLSFDTKVSDRLFMIAIGWTSRFSPEVEIAALRQLVDPEKLSIDIGAAYGLYSWNLAKLCRRCIAFEPNPRSARKIANGLPNVEVHNCALSDHKGNSKLRIPKKGRNTLPGYATIEPDFQDAFEHWDEIDVSTHTLDSFEFKNVGFIKIDVEGHELSVLRGAESTISRDSPVLLIEISESWKGEKRTHRVFEWLAATGYVVSDFKTSPQNFAFKKLR